jgi:4-alpha-glucanotransferase
VLLHPTSLPGAYGIGDLGRSATEFVTFLAAAGQHVWQVLPLGPTGYGDSPYQSFSAFAGNPLLISLDALIDDGWLSETAVRRDAPASSGSINYPDVIAHRRALWPHLLDRLDTAGHAAVADAFARFCREQAHWLDDFALFMALKEAHGQRAWTTWPAEIAARDPGAVTRWGRELQREVRQHQLTQYVFFTQWNRVREQCRAHGVTLLGDLPIFVAHDSADVWARRDLFKLGANGRPAVVAGVPPDYFSATGQLWGNPHYDWERLAATGYEWWTARVRALLTLVDRIRLDHFRGFVAAWEVPGDATTAVHGVWRAGPGAAFFAALEAGLGQRPLPFVAENLGVITPEVEGLRTQFQLPGMAILQFAFGTDPQAPDFRPHNYSKHLVVYTGTHDNDTTVGWWSDTAGHSTRSELDVRQERELASRYLAIGHDVHWDLIRAALASVAQLAIIPTQDLLGLGSEARMNRPGTMSDNWRWQLRTGQLTAEIATRLRNLSDTYERS